MFNWTTRNTEDPQKFQGLGQAISWLSAPIPVAGGATAGGIRYQDQLIWDWTSGVFLQTNSFGGTTFSWVFDLTVFAAPIIPPQAGDVGRGRRKKADVGQGNVVCMIETIRRIL